MTHRDCHTMKKLFHFSASHCLCQFLQFLSVTPIRCLFYCRFKFNHIQICIYLLLTVKEILLLLILCARDKTERTGEVALCTSCNMDKLIVVVIHFATMQINFHSPLLAFNSFFAVRRSCDNKRRKKLKTKKFFAFCMLLCTRLQSNISVQVAHTPHMNGVARTKLFLHKHSTPSLFLAVLMTFEMMHNSNKLFIVQSTEQCNIRLHCHSLCSLSLSLAFLWNKRELYSISSRCNNRLCARSFVRFEFECKLRSGEGSVSNDNTHFKRFSLALSL
jgi:hypothetical protein